MKKYIYTLILAAITLGLQGQITITESDMPLSGDTIRTSTTLPTSVGLNIPAGANITWDYSGFTAQSQTVTEFEDISQLPFTYQAVFNNPLNPSLMADYGVTGGDSINIPNIQVTDPYTFYKKNSSAYSIVGFGVTISGFSIPAAYDNPDLLYEFPLNYGDSSSSHSISGQSVPSLGYFEREVTRDNEVDGWGTLITPYGTFDVVRVKSEVIQRDSINFDSLPAFPAITTNRTEIKFLGKGQGIPLLTITQQSGITVNVEYIDSVRNVNTSTGNLEQKESNLYPNPVYGEATLSWHADFQDLKIYNALGQLLFQADVKNRKRYTIGEDILSTTGIYIIELTGEKAYSHQKLLKK
ncbi:MAG: T9SS type A sorting domain-containing protein [Bacteroidales bacterium]|nr:T9SS type A sorting domain-containing protein [Bacteroidales bacterium]